MNVLVPGGCGYIGAWLVPQLLAEGHRVTVLDTHWFGSGHLPGDNENLKIIKGDIRGYSIWMEACNNQDAVIFLASLSSDAMCKKDPELAAAVNFKHFAGCVVGAKTQGVSRFIYASSVAGYMNENSLECEALAPVTLYTQHKAACEEVLRQEMDQPWVITRSASVCGYSPHQRLDLTVNMMVHNACRKGVVFVAGGEQKRSHIHIHDITDFYKLLLKAPLDDIKGQIFNVVAENQSVLETGTLVAETTGAAIIKIPRTDTRSYGASGAKAKEVLGFTPKRTIADAIMDLEIKFDNGYWPDSLTNPVYQNIADGLS